MDVDSVSNFEDPLTIPNIPKGTATAKEYASNRVAQEAVALALSKGKFAHLNFQEKDTDRQINEGADWIFAREGSIQRGIRLSNGIIGLP